MDSEIFFEEIKKQIKQELLNAKESVFIAVAWFTDDDLFLELISLSKKGIMVQLIINDDEINSKSEMNFSLLFQNGGMVYYTNISESLMHNKFCIIDKKNVLNGSYNWTKKANSNFENLTITRDENIADKFLKQFELIKTHSRQFFDNSLKSRINWEYEKISFEDLVERAKSRKKNSNYLASLVDYKKALNICPEKSNLLFDIAFCQAELEDFNNSLENYCKYLTKFPNSSSAFNNRGIIYEKLEKFNLAIDDFNKALEIKYDIIYLKNRARVKLSYIKNYKNTKTSLFDNKYPIQLPFLETFENNKKFKFGILGKLEHFENIILEGINDYKEVLKINREKNIFILEKIANAYYELGVYDESIYYFGKAIFYEPKNDFLYYSRAWAHYLNNELNNSLNDFEYALKISPHDEYYKKGVKMIKKEKLKFKNWFI